MATILAVHAHPDDIEILMGGTLALLAGQGHTITVVSATAGEGGSAEFDPDATGRIRQAEATASAALIGAQYRCLGFPDLSVFNDDPSRRAVTELVRWARPDVVITGSPADYHPDHEAISLLVRDACFAAPVANYRTGPSAALDAIPALYFVDAIGGRDRQGQRIPRDFGVDIAATFATKQAMLAKHESQASWVLKQHGIADHLADMDAWTRRVGRDFGVGLAEGFRQYRHTPYPKTPVLQDLVGDALLANP
ncbi:MAG: PIG-L family deacetylase [Alphaproteobacteria bacterium]|nr:PIG-L family deacetylase [Alphaproteobacteria bacterium]MBU1515093.1 PIG-L family deacetylase [Alphaproteobacteria bacterium]MBU2093451.1 PIG-L family deacetylase [Alphaproteobacteria bacterium]MBU2152299.1 PIG-L family deacetylase [Alphaproteobacteria bacterium]MBU2308113.1 PIG-L family deacetylase [Alphaproteobacteria bacterium]